MNNEGQATSRPQGCLRLALLVFRRENWRNKCVCRNRPDRPTMRAQVKLIRVAEPDGDCCPWVKLTRAWCKRPMRRSGLVVILAYGRSDAGTEVDFRLCRELKEHSEFNSIP